MVRTAVKAVFGGVSYDFGCSNENVEQSYRLLAAGGCDKIDTAHVYGSSEECLGETNAPSRFAIDSKAPGGVKPGNSSPEDIVKQAEESLRKLGVKQFDIYYIHAPDPDAPMEDVARGFNEAYRKGHFKRFGLSNFTAAQVQEIHGIASRNGWVLPTVYQGSYSAVARLQETEIFPTVRRLGMSFYAYSPMAAGLLTKTAEQIQRQSEDAGQFRKSSLGSLVYGAMYNKPSMLKGLRAWAEAAEAAGCSKAELAYRWVAFDSFLDPAKGDAVIFGASKLSQIEETLNWFKKGSVGPEAKAKIEQLWESIKGDATLNNTDENGVLHGMKPAS